MRLCYTNLNSSQISFRKLLVVLLVILLLLDNNKRALQFFIIDRVSLTLLKG